MRIPKQKTPETQIVKNDSYEADPLCIKLQKIMEGKGKIDESAPIIYTEKRQGVIPSYDIRTDRFEVARVAKEKLREIIAKREETPKAESGAENSNSDGNLDGTAV